MTDWTDRVATLAQTSALRRALATIRDGRCIADLLFLETWEMQPLPGAAAALRVNQLRRANPDLAAAIRAEVASRPVPPFNPPLDRNRGARL